MKKLLTYLAAAVVLTVPNAKATGSSSVFDESGAFVVARSVKLGDTNISSFSPKTSEAAQKTCDPNDPTCSGGKHCDSGSDCADGEYCTTVHVCKPLCEKNITSDKVKCSGETPVCTASNHKSYCACTDDSCPNAYKCAESGKSASCSACSKDEECGCPAGTVSNGSGQCVTCNFDTKCADDQYCANAGTASSSCQTVSCDADKYAADHTCKSCSDAIANCAECNNAKACLVCQKGYDLVDGKCELHDCGPGQYLNMDDGQCYSCINGCKSCSNGSTCDACENAYDLQEGLCVIKDCNKDGKEGMYLVTETGECLSCPSTCTACSTVMTSTETSICTACAEGYTLDEATGACRPLNCSDAEYVKGNECLPCSGSISNCLTCSGENTCTKCANGYTLENGQCVGIDCAAGSYLNTTKDPASCDSCSSPCATCSGSATSCTSCIDGYKLSRSDKFSRATCVQKSCSEMGFSTSCQSGYTASYITSGSDGKCYSCSKPGDYCASDSDCTDAYEKCVNYKCVKKSCSEIGSDLKTSCSAGYNAVDAHVSGSDGKCYECRKIDGYCSSNSDCSDSTYKCSNNSCVKKSCSEINSSYKTSCSEGQNKDSTGVSGSDGTCYTCSAISGWCSSNSDCGDTEKCVNNGCTKKSCGEMGYATSCASGYTASSAGVTGSDGACVTCPASACPNGYSTSTTSCGTGYTLETNGYSGSSACGKCVAAACPANTATSISCSAGQKAQNTSSYSGGNVCKQCADCTKGATDCGCSSGQVANGNGGCMKACTYYSASACRNGINNCSESKANSDGCYVCTTCRSPYKLASNGTCEYDCSVNFPNCEQCTANGNQCTKCKDGYTLSEDGQECYKAKKCSTGYSTNVTSCSSGYKLETSGTENGKACGKCVQQTCAEMGYSRSCSSGYVAKTYGSNGSNFTWTTSGADGSCYECVKGCPSGYSTSVTSCGAGYKLETNGTSGGSACGQCVSRCSKGYHWDTSKGYCVCTTEASYDYNCGANVPKRVVCASAGETVAADFGKSCTSYTQCINGCAPCLTMINGTVQGSTCR